MDKEQIIKEYMTGLAYKSVEVQKKKYGKKKFKEMGKKSGEARRKKRDIKLQKEIREEMVADGEAIEGLILK